MSKKVKQATTQSSTHVAEQTDRQKSTLENKQEINSKTSEQKGRKGTNEESKQAEM